MHSCAEKKTFSGTDYLTILERVVGGNAFKRVYPARAYSTLVVLVSIDLNDVN